MQSYSMPGRLYAPMARYKARRRENRADPLQRYDILGYIAAGTYGRVHKARLKEDGRLCAIKKFKADKEGEVAYYTGISQSAYREMALCKELHHANVIYLVETILEDKSIYLVFDYAEHDLLQLIHYHSHMNNRAFPPVTVKSILYQILNGVDYLHKNWVLHRDLKPANIMITASGVVKIGDLGLARIFRKPLQPLYSGDKVVVTIWYRAPELLLGGRHYTPAIDMWAIGCIFAEMLALRPIFKSEEAKMDSKKVVPFQRDQVQKMIEILGTPNASKWPDITAYPDYPQLTTMRIYSNVLDQWYRGVHQTNKPGLDLMQQMFCYDPFKRVTAASAMNHGYFKEEPEPQLNAFEGTKINYPVRRITSDTKIKAPHSSKRPLSEEPGVRKKTKQ